MVAHRTADVARGQLSFLYGHFRYRVSRSGGMDRTFARFVSEAGDRGRELRKIPLR